MTIVNDLRTKGVPLDGVGHQFHMPVTLDPAQCEAALQAVDALGAGLENHVTELDISIYNDPGSCFSGVGCQPEIITPSYAVMADQARLYRTLFNNFAARASVTSVTTWGIHDGQSWLNNFPVTGRDNHPLLFDRNVEPKRALWAVADPTFTI